MGVEFSFNVEQVVKGLRMVEEIIDDVMVEAAELNASIVRDRARDVHDYKDSQDATLTNSIQHGVVEGSFLAGTLEIEVAAGAPHGVYIEHGTKDHKVAPRHKKALRWPVEGGYAFSKGHIVKGIKAREFLDKALEHESDSIVEIFSDAAEFVFEKAGLG